MKTALITGSSRGLGRAMALRLAKDGFACIIHYSTSAKDAETVAGQIISGGGKAFTVQSDQSKVPSIEKMFETIDRELEPQFGETGLDVLINNAGTVVMKETWTEADFDYQFAINVKGVFFTTQLAIPRMRRGGRIINLGTGLTRYTVPPYLVYAASKGAVNVMTQYYAAILGEKEITVNTLAPGATETDLTAALFGNESVRNQTIAAQALKRTGQPDDIADLASFLASPDSRWVTGQRIEASGGSRL